MLQLIRSSRRPLKLGGGSSGDARMRALRFASISRLFWRGRLPKYSERSVLKETFSAEAICTQRWQSFAEKGEVTRMLSREFGWSATNPGWSTQAPSQGWCQLHAVASNGPFEVYTTPGNSRRHFSKTSVDWACRNLSHDQSKVGTSFLGCQFLPQEQSLTPLTSFLPSGSTIRGQIPLAYGQSSTHKPLERAAFHSEATPLPASFTRSYPNGNAALDTPASSSFSVRSPHGAGTEGLASEPLRRMDTDQAANQSSTDPSAVKDVLWGRKQQAFTPSAPPPTDEEIQALHDFIIESEKLLIVTGAGVSTESGIPDYRSPTGAYSTGFKPMTHQVRALTEIIGF